jgi:hypothetical protein
MHAAADEFYSNTIEAYCHVLVDLKSHQIDHNVHHNSKPPLLREALSAFVQAI